MRHLKAAEVLLLAATSLLSAGEAPTRSERQIAGAGDTEPVRLDGEVTNEQGQPVEGATVGLYEGTIDKATNEYRAGRRAELTTQQDGAFSFEFESSQDPYRHAIIIAEKPGLSLGWASWWYRAPRRKFEITLTAPAELTGRVVDEKDQPIPDADVTISLLCPHPGHGNYRIGHAFGERLSATTDRQGAFRIGHLPKTATAELVVQAPGKGTVSTFEPQIGLQYAAGRKDIRIVLEPEARIEGSVLPKDTRKPVAGVRLLAARVGDRSGFGQPSAISRDDGRFVFRGLRSGAYQLRMVPPAEGLADWAAAPVRVDLETGKTAAAKIEVEKGAVLEVLVSDQESKRPLARAGINVQSTDRDGLVPGIAGTGADGIAAVRLLPGTYRVGGVGRDGYSSDMKWETVQLLAGKTERVEFQMTPQPKIKGAVRDSNANSVEGAEVSVGPSVTGSVRSDSDGLFELSWDPRWARDPQATPFIVARHKEHNLSATVEFDRETASVVLTLAPGVVLAGRIVDTEGKPIAGAHVCPFFHRARRWSVRGYLDRQQTDADGRYEIRAVPAGYRYWLQVAGRGYGESKADVDLCDVTRDKVQVDDIRLDPARVSIAGSVVDREGKPVPHIQVFLSGEGQPHRSTATDKEGRFRIEGICEGQVHIRTMARGGRTGRGVDAEAGDEDIKLVVGEQSVKGKLTDPKGEPVGGAEVQFAPLLCPAVTSGADGTFEMTWDPAGWHGKDGRMPLVLARHPGRNLAGAGELGDGVESVVLALDAGAMIAGRVLTTDGEPIPQAKVSVSIRIPAPYVMTPVAGALRTAANGRYEMRGVPRGHQYIINATADGYGRTRANVDLSDLQADRVQVGDFRLAVTDLSITGTLVDGNGKPVADTRVNMSGEGQPYRHATTDREGRFTIESVSRGDVRLYVRAYHGRAPDRKRRASANVKAGDKDVRLVLGREAGRIYTRGRIKDENGNPVEGAHVMTVPMAGAAGGRATTAADGTFELGWDPLCLTGTAWSTPLILAQHEVRNLAGAVEFGQGTESVEVTLESGAVLTGRVMGVDGRPIAEAEVFAEVCTGSRRSRLGGPVRRTGAAGRYEIRAVPKGQKYSVCASADGHAESRADVDVGPTESDRVRVADICLRAIVASIAGVVVDRAGEPVRDATVNLTGEGQPQGRSATTDRNGRFTIEKISAGGVRLDAHARGGKERGSVDAKAGDRQVRLVLGRQAGDQLVRGTVRDSKGDPVKGADLMIVPMGDRYGKSDAAGRFELGWDPTRWREGDGLLPVILARHGGRGLAAAVEFDHETESVELTLQPGTVLTGRVVTSDGKPLAGARVSVDMRDSGWSSPIGRQPQRTDAAGRYEVNALPPGCRYAVNVSADGYGQASLEIDVSDLGTRRTEVADIRLAPADMSIAGTVVDGDGKPVGNVHVELRGGGQPYRSATTDRQGRFTIHRICRGAVRLQAYASVGRRHGLVDAKAGDENVELVLGQQQTRQRERPAPVPAPSLVGRALPAFSTVDSQLKPEQTEGKRVLVCFWDMTQRPSRHCVMSLTGKAEALKASGVTIVLVHVSPVDRGTVEEWMAGHGVSLPVGVIASKPDEVRYVWGARGLPWLILTDAQHTVRADGFVLAELEEKLSADAQE